VKSEVVARYGTTVLAVSALAGPSKPDTFSQVSFSGDRDALAAFNERLKSAAATVKSSIIPQPSKPSPSTEAPKEKPWYDFLNIFNEEPEPPKGDTPQRKPWYDFLDLYGKPEAADQKPQKSPRASAPLRPVSKPAEPLEKTQLFEGTSEILNETDLLSIRGALPQRFVKGCWILKFQLSRDGTSYRSLFQKTENVSPLVVAVKTNGGERIGCFIPSGIHESGQEYGTKGTFVFKCGPKFAIHRASEANQFFVFTDAQQISIGGGGGAAIWIDANLLDARSEVCLTFNSPVLTAQSQFKVLNLEVWQVESRLSRAADHFE
jgi:hypothetical protein